MKKDQSLYITASFCRMVLSVSQCHAIVTVSICHNYWSYTHVSVRNNWSLSTSQSTQPESSLVRVGVPFWSAMALAHSSTMVRDCHTLDLAVTDSVYWTVSVALMSLSVSYFILFYPVVITVSIHHCLCLSPPHHCLYLTHFVLWLSLSLPCK